MSWICYFCILCLWYSFWRMWKSAQMNNTLKYYWNDTPELQNLQNSSASYSMTLQPGRVKRIIFSRLLWLFFILQSFSDHFPVCGHRVSSSSHLSSSPRTSALLAYHPAVMNKQCCCWGAQSLAEVVSLASWAPINHSSSHGHAMHAKFAFALVHLINVLLFSAKKRCLSLYCS